MGEDRGDPEGRAGVKGSLTVASGSNLRTDVLLRSEQSGGHVYLMENVVPARNPGLLVCTPAGLERIFTRAAGASRGVEPPDWALQPSPEIIEVGGQIPWDG